MNACRSRTGQLRFFLLLTLLAGIYACKPSAADPQATMPHTTTPTPMEAVVLPPTSVPQMSEGTSRAPTSAVTAELPFPTSTSQAPPTEAVVELIGPGDFGPNVNPLTGETVDDPAILRRRPIAIKISNIARVRPQSGLNNADLVFEHLTEGGITRFTAIFYSQDSSYVGSIRSGRLIDLEIPLMYDAAFGYSGSSAPLRLMFLESSFFDRIVSPDFAHGGYWRDFDPSKPRQALEDTMFTNTHTLREALRRKGQDTPPDLANAMAFHVDPPEGGTPASALDIQYPATNAYWSYDIRNGRYLRWSDGVRHVDANSDEQLSFKNIVLLYAQHHDTEIIEDSGGSPSIQIRIWGEGPVSVFRDGRRFDGLWRREEPKHMLTFHDLSGNAIPLAPGNTFFQIVPLDFNRLSVKP